MILLLGAGGYLGNLLATSLSKFTANLVVTVSRSYQWEKISSETRICASVSDFKAYSCHINLDTTIIYLAGATDLKIAQEHSSNDLSFHISEMESFFSQLEKSKVQCKAILFLSSAGAIYGDSYGVPKAEFVQPFPKSAYGKRNVLLETLFMLSCKVQNQKNSILRISNPFGPGQQFFRRKGLINLLIESHYTKQEVTLRGNGLQRRDYLFADDFNLIFDRLVNSGSYPDILNVCSGYSFSAIEIVSILNANNIFPNVRYSSQQFSYEVLDSILSNYQLCESCGLKAENLNPFLDHKMHQLIESHLSIEQ